MSRLEHDAWDESKLGEVGDRLGLADDNKLETDCVSGEAGLDGLHNDDRDMSA